MAKEGKQIKTIVRNSLLRLASKEFLVFLFFLVISGLFWVALTIKEPMEREISIPFVITNLPKNIVITDTGTDTLKVAVRDDGYNVARLLYSDIAPITADFIKYSKSDGRIIVSSSEVSKKVKQRLGSSTQVLSIKPERIEAYYNNGDHIMVPVDIYGKISAADKYFITKTTIKPDSVKIYSTAEILKDITSVKTEYVNLYDVKSNATTKVKLQHISGVKMEPEEVTVEASADLITEKTLDVPITIVGAPEGKKVLTFPKHVSVTFVTPSSLASSIKASDFIVEVRYDEIRDDSLQKMLPLHLVQVPPFVKNAKMGIRQVDYLIEKE
jgi:hypothetical protein